MKSILMALAVAALATTVSAQAPKAAPKKLDPPLTRLFVQDQKACTLKWADVRLDRAGAVFSLDSLNSVEGFKPLDPARQRLVQMRQAGRMVCLGVRDDSDGAFESGWVLLRTGVGYLDHGDHGHWSYRARPAVADHRLDAKQGNPAHLYEYDGRFFLANDKLNGYTRLDPAAYTASGKGEPRFLVGGGNHITLAVVDDKVGYSCWIDGAGPNKGRVDVTPLAARPRSEPAYSCHLPTGGIHGAIANSGKVFFAPSDGVCWIDADVGLASKAELVQVRHVPLGMDGDKPRRTGAFVNHGHHVAFVTGREASSALVLLNAKHAEPKPIVVPLAVKPGSRATTPHLVTAADGKALALVFHDHAKNVDMQDLPDVVALDPNGDGDCSDAKVVKTLKVGRSAVEGHSGHHDLAFDADHRFGFFTNPGDGTLSVLSLRTLEVVATFAVGGSPAALVACGGGEVKD